MGRSRRHHKRFQTSKAKVGLIKRTTHKNPRKPEAVKLPGGEEIISWPEKATLQSNYEAVGLAVNPNKIGERLGKRGDIAELVKVKDGKVVALDEADDDPDDEEITDELRGAVGRPRKEEKRALPALTRMQRVYVRELQEKYGEDYEEVAMVRTKASSPHFLLPCVLLILSSLCLQSLSKSCNGCALRSTDEVSSWINLLWKPSQVFNHCTSRFHKAMSKDIKLNKLQHTEGALRYLFERYKAHPKLLKRDQMK